MQLLTTNVVTKACWAAVLLLLLRNLGAAPFGILATLWSIAGIAGGFADLGTGQALLREGSRTHGVARQLAKQSALVQGMLTFALVALLAFGSWLLLPTPGLHGVARATVIVLGIATPLIDRFQSLFTVYSQIGGNYNIYSRVRSIYFISILVAMIGVIWSGGGLLTISLVYFVLTILFSAIMGRKTWTLLPLSETQVQPAVKPLIVSGIPFLLVTTFALAYGRLEVAILGLFGLSAVAGSYHVIYQAVLLIYSVVGMFFTVAYPRLYRHHGNRQALSADFRDTCTWLSLLAWLAALPMWLFAVPVLKLVGGTELAAHATLLKILAGLTLILPAQASLNFLLPADKLSWRVVCDVTGLAIILVIAILAASHDRPLLVAGGGVLGYAVAATLAHVKLRRMLPDATHIGVQEFFSVGIRVAPMAYIAWLLPGWWWWRLCAFLFLSALALLTHLQVRNRVRGWLSHWNQ